MDKVQMASEILAVVKSLVSVKFDTKKEMDEYKREHGQHPGTKLELRDKREMQERYKDRRSSEVRTAAAGPHSILLDLERDLSRGPALFNWDMWVFSMGHARGVDYIVGAGEPIVRNLIALGLQDEGITDIDKKRVWHVLVADIRLAVKDNEIFRGMSAERCFETWKDYMQGKRAVASEVVKVAEGLVESVVDMMAAERIGSLYMALEKWVTQTATSRPPGAPIVTQLLKSLNEVRSRLKGKGSLHGRDAVEAMIQAMSRLFTVDAPPLRRLWRKYGDEVEQMLYKYRILP